MVRREKELVFGCSIAVDGILSTLRVPYISKK
jgi:hypothetical protein